MLTNHLNKRINILENKYSDTLSLKMVLSFISSSLSSLSDVYTCYFLVFLVTFFLFFVC